MSETKRRTFVGGTLEDIKVYRDGTGNLAGMSIAIGKAEIQTTQHVFLDIDQCWDIAKENFKSCMENMEDFLRERKTNDAADAYFFVDKAKDIKRLQQYVTAMQLVAKELYGIRRRKEKNT